MVHATDAVPVVEDSGEQDWQPGLGAIPFLANPFAGPSSGLIVNLATGNLTYLPKPDMIGRNPDGSDAVFNRSYRSDLAQRGISTPGLTPGWIHGWDVFISGKEPAKASSKLELLYPNGVREDFEPELDNSGQPTGKFKQYQRPFILTGTPSQTTPGQWEKLTLSWQGNTTWTFTLSADKRFWMLRQIDDLLIEWDNTTRIRAVRSVHKPKDFLLSFTYRQSDGMLIAVTDAFNRSTEFVYDVPPADAGMGTKPLLTKVSQMHTGANTLPYRQTYSYTLADGKVVLNKVSVPINNGYSTATISYQNKTVAMQTDANGNRRVYIYQPVGTRVEVWEPKATRPLTFRTENIDAEGRHTGTTDAAGHSTKISYGN